MAHRPYQKLHIRDQHGSYLIELLVALAISGMLAAVMGSSVSQTKSISNRTENGLVATMIAQQVFERLRSVPFDNLPSVGTPHAIRVNLGDSSDPTSYEANQPMLGRPLMIDGTNLLWLVGDPSSPIPSYKFRGSVNLQIIDGPVAGGVAPVTKTATVTVTWEDNTANAPHSVQITRMLSRFGIQRDAQQ